MKDWTTWQWTKLFYRVLNAAMIVTGTFAALYLAVWWLLGVWFTW